MTVTMTISSDVTNVWQCNHDTTLTLTLDSKIKNQSKLKLKLKRKLKETWI